MLNGYEKTIADVLRKMQIGKNIGEIRCYFENVAIPYCLFHEPEALMRGIEEDPLFPFKLFDEVMKEMNLDNEYVLTRDMTITERLEDGDRFAVITFPEPTVDGLCHALLLFTDADYDYPGYFVVMKTNNDTMHLISWDYEATNFDIGKLDTREEASLVAYEVYKKGRAEAKKNEAKK